MRHTPFLWARFASPAVLAVGLLLTALQTAAQVTFEFSTAQRGPVIGPLHYGIFYEEINHAGDGGLYAELVRNGSMEENASNPDYWWTLGTATFGISSENLLNGAQKHAMRLKLNKGGDGTRNIGYWGINIVKGRTYKASLWMRGDDGWTGDLTLTLESYEGADLGHATVHVDESGTWKKYTTEITATGAYQLGWLAIRGSQKGTIYLDCVSLFPPTYKDRENGMRKDLAEKLAALHPRFMRFPGGCYIEGGARYQWRHTVGPVEERLGIYNSNWGYPVTNGMGYHEFLQLCEDLGAEPLFVVNVGMGHGWYEDYRHIEGYIQEALEAIEYANGDVTTFWGAKRAAAGHPESFNLRLLEIGNENYNFIADSNTDHSDHYAERYYQFYKAIKARYPEMVCIGNVESWGTDLPTWRNQYAVDVVDEHYYRSPDWFAANYHKYDRASRSSHRIYNGEYAVTSDFGTNGTLKAALGEAIYMAGMERNSDVCVMASYAPIFMNENEAQWRPDMIHYNAYTSFGTPSYWVQQMMAETVGHQNITWTETGNDVGLLNAGLGLGSWGTSATYSNITVTQADGTVLLEQSGKVNSPATVNGASRVFNIDTNDCTIELDAVKNSGDEGFLIAFAYADANNYAWWNLGGWGNTAHGVEQCIGGSKQTLVSTSGTIATGQTYHIKIVRSGYMARCYLDDKLIHTVTLADDAGQRLYTCAALNEVGDTAIVKVINYSGEATETTLRFADATIGGDASIRVMSHTDNYAENSMSNPLKVKPVSVSVGFADGSDSDLSYTVPAFSLSVISIPLSSVSPEQTLEPETPPVPVVSYSFESTSAQDDGGNLQATLQGGAAILQLADGNQALYTGDNAGNGYLDLGNDAAKAIGEVAGGEAYSVSINILLNGGGHLNSFCWAWNINNGSGSYVALVNAPNNLDWYFEKLRGTTIKVSSNAGLCQGQWHNITVISDATTTSLYVDGDLRATAAANTRALPLTNSTKAWIGRSPFSGDARLTDAFFDDFAVYDTALTPAQVLSLAQEAAAKSTDCQALQPEAVTEPDANAMALIGDGEQEVDVTSLLTNADFSLGKDGWEGTKFSAAPGTVAEHFYQLFDTYQVLPNMPAGYYRLSWQGFYRDGNIANAYLRHSLGEESLAEVYASATAVTVPDPSPSDIATQSLLSLYDADAPYTYSPYTYPDNVTTADDAFKADHYQQQLSFSLPETADLRIGLRNFTPTVYDWACVDNFYLYYICREPTCITLIPAGTSAGGNQCYDLSGRRLSGLQSLRRGIYIVGGRKVVVK